MLAFDDEVPSWRELLWTTIASYSKTQYLFRANFYRVTLCDPLKKIVANIRTGKYFPTNTDKLFRDVYNKCIERKQQNK